MRIAEFLALVLFGAVVILLAYVTSRQQEAMYALAERMDSTDATIASVIAERDAERSR